MVVPEPIADYSTSRVLTMEYVHRKKITDLSPLGRMEFDGDDLAEEVFRAYLDQILVHGFFHADPHPENVFLTTVTSSRSSISEWSAALCRAAGTIAAVAPLDSRRRGDDAADIAIKTKRITSTRRNSAAALVRSW